MSPVRRHGVCTGDSTKRDSPFISPFVSHHTHAAHGKQDDTRLPHLAIQSPLSQSTDEDVVGVLQDAHLFWGDVAKDTHGKPRSGERMAIDKMLGHMKLAADTAHLILEEPSQRFAKAQVHLFGQSAHVVVTLDDFACDVEALDAVGINRALCEPTGVFYFLCLGLKDIDKALADNFALLLRVVHTGQLAEKLLAGVDSDHVEAQSAIVVHHVVELILAQHSVIDKNAGQPLSDGSMKQDGGHRRINTSAQSENHAVLPQLLAQLSHRGFNERGRTPILAAATNVHHKVTQQLRALRRVEHFRVELHAPKLFAVCLVCGINHLVGRRDGMEAFRQGCNGIAMAHPDLRPGIKSFKQRIRRIEMAEHGPPVLPAAGRLHLSAIKLGHILGTVTDAQYGITATDFRKVWMEGFGVVHTERRTTEDDSDHVRIVCGKLVVRDDLAERIELAHPTTDELRRL